MRYPLFLLAIIITLSSCNSEDTFTGVWSKNYNEQYDAAAFPLWEKSRDRLDAQKANTPFFIRITKELDGYTLRCYQYDGAQQSVVAENTIFDFVKFKKTDNHTLMSDNAASGIHMEQKILAHVDEGTGELVMKFPVTDKELPKDKRIKALFKSVFSSGYHKLLTIRRKTADAGIIDSKLREEKVILP